MISARLVEDAGFPAVASTSAGVAAVLGYPDGQRIPRSEMLEFVARMAREVSVPVTADMEAGYATTPAEMAEMARQVVAAGIVGLNLEDVTGDDESSQLEIALQAEKIAAVREASASAGVSLVINARTDVYLMPIGPAETRFERTVERLSAYRKAGADCVFRAGNPRCGDDRETSAGRGCSAEYFVAAGQPDVDRTGKAWSSTSEYWVRNDACGARGRREISLRRSTKVADHWKFFADAVPYDEVNRLLGRA